MSSFSSDYNCDGEFVKLLSRRLDVDLTVAALEIARDVYPTLDFPAVMDWLDARADEIATVVARAPTEQAALVELGQCLSHKHGLRGDCEAYGSADSSYLNRVIATGRGIPISLSILYMAVGERVGLDLQGVAAPAHFLVRYESIEGPLFVDPFSCGRVMSPLQCKKFLHEAAHVPRELLCSALEPAHARTIILRMLNNLKSLYVKQENWQCAWLVQHRLTALEPACYEQRRDLAIISLRAQRPGHAIDLLESCLKNCPKSERPLIEAQLRDASRLLAQWN